MRIGPFKFREKPPTEAEAGATGTLFFRGRLVEEEYNADLRGTKAIEVYERMRKSDGQVKAGLLACELPLRSANWDIEPASDSRQDIQVAEFIRSNLFDDMSITWDDFLRHILLMLPFGHSVFEKVYKLDNGNVKWRKMAPRLPKSIVDWHLDAEGGLAGITQRATKGDQYQTIYIPIEKLLVFSLGREGSDHRGTSLLRAAYKHWYYKDQLYRIDGIAAERHGVGLAYFKLPPTVSAEEKDTIDKIGRTLHSHERSYVALPDRFEFDLKGVAGQLHDIIKSVEHHDLQIVRSLLAQFISLGSGEVGSYALSQDQSGFFLMALRSVALGICDTVNRYAIPQLVDYNWDVDKYPKLSVSGLEVRDIGTYCKAVSDLVSAGILLPDDAMEAELRKLLRFPPKQMTGATGKAAASEAMHLVEWKPWRKPQGLEVHMSLTDIDKRLKSATEEFVDATKRVQDRQIDKIVDTIIKMVEQGRADRVGDIDVPLRDEMATAVEGVLGGLFDYGRQQVRSELEKQRKAMAMQEPLPPTKLEALMDFLTARAKATSSVLSSRLKAAITWEALSQIKDGRVSRPGLVGSLTALSDKELQRTAGFSVNEAFNLGRRGEAAAHADEIDRVIYSAILDENVCPACAEQDGKEFTFGGAEYEEHQPPYRECEGRDRCRCVYIYVHKTERGG